MAIPKKFEALLLQTGLEEENQVAVQENHSLGLQKLYDGKLKHKAYLCCKTFIIDCDFQLYQRASDYCPIMPKIQQQLCKKVYIDESIFMLLARQTRLQALLQK